MKVRCNCRGNRPQAAVGGGSVLSVPGEPVLVVARAESALFWWQGCATDGCSIAAAGAWVTIRIGAARWFSPGRAQPKPVGRSGCGRADAASASSAAFCAANSGRV